VFAVAFACVVSFMGIGLVDPGGTAGSLGRLQLCPVHRRRPRPLRGGQAGPRRGSRLQPTGL